METYAILVDGFTDMALGCVPTSAMLFFVGMAIGPAIASFYMQSNQISINGSSISFPSLESYDMIFITAFFISVISIALMLVLKKKMSNVIIRTS